MDILHLFFIIYFFINHNKSQTIFSIIESRADLSQLKSFMKEEYVDDINEGFQLDITSKLDSRSNIYKYAFFAPNNEAFDLIENKDPTKHDFWDEVFSRHLVEIIDRDRVPQITRADWTEMTYTASNSYSSLFFRRVENSFFVNGARAIGNEIECINGILHIVNKIFYEEILNRNIEQFIQSNAASKVPYSIHQFSNMLLSDEDIRQIFTVTSAAPSNAALTVFMPVDDAFASLEIWEEVKNMLNSKPQKKFEVLHSHIICCHLTSVYHANVLTQLAPRDGTSTAITDGTDPDYPYEQINVRISGNTLYVDNKCTAKIVKSDISLNNGVIHYIDNLLGYTHSAAYNYIQHSELLKDFGDYLENLPTSTLASITASDGDEIPEDRLVTVFAPENLAFRGTSAILQDMKTLEKIMKMHIVDGVLNSVQLEEGGTVTTKSSPYRARYYKYEGDLYVEVDHVRGRIIQSDICVQNGVIHIIDTMLGYPTSSLFTAIDADNDLIEFMQLIRRAGMLGYLNGETKYTVFAPTDAALNEMRIGGIGSQILNSNRELKNLLRRHILLGEHFVPDENNIAENIPNSEYLLERINQVSPSVKFESQRFTIKSPNNRHTNGVLHVMDRVIYLETPSYFESLASSALHLKVTLICSSRMFFIIITCVVLRRLLI